MLITIYSSKQISYIRQKKIHTQNIMVICNFHMHFIFVWARYEGTLHYIHFVYLFIYLLKAIRKEELGFLLNVPFYYYLCYVLKIY